MGKTQHGHLARKNCNKWVHGDTVSVSHMRGLLCKCGTMSSARTEETCIQIHALKKHVKVKLGHSLFFSLTYLKNCFLE